MKNKKYRKGILVGVLSLVVLILIMGVTYAYFVYSKTSMNQILVTGDIYMKYHEVNSLNITNAMPKEYVSEDDKYFEFNIEGVNNYSKDIYYEIVLNLGDKDKNRNTRIKDDLLLFKLVEVKDNKEEVIFDRMSYPNLNNRIIWVDTIPSNTKDNIVRTYRLYMWVSPLTIVGNSSNKDYDIETWNNQVYGSVKVTVQGDFTKKEAYSCFLGVTKLNYNYERSEEQVNACTEIFEGASFREWFSSTENARAYCEGTGTSNGATMNDDALNSSTFGGYKDRLIEIGIIKEMPTDLSTIGGYLDECSKKLVIPSVFNKNIVTTLGGNAFREKQLVSVNIPNTITELGYGTFFGNNLTEVIIPDGMKTIGETSFYRNKLVSLSIPESVTVIKNYAFAENNLESLKFPNNLIEIGKESFMSNKLRSINIPDSVTTIGSQAFAANDLRKVTIGNGITYIADAAFAKNRYIQDLNIRNKDLESITIDKSCDEIKTIMGSNTNSNKYYPWLGGEEAYRKGTTIYGKNNTICNTYQ